METVSGRAEDILCRRNAREGKRHIIKANPTSRSNCQILGLARAQSTIHDQAFGAS